MEDSTQTLEGAMASVQKNSERFDKSNVWVQLGEEMAQALGEPSLGTVIDKEATEVALRKFAKLGDEIAIQLGYKDIKDLQQNESATV